MLGGANLTSVGQIEDSFGGSWYSWKLLKFPNEFHCPLGIWICPDLVFEEKKDFIGSCQSFLHNLYNIDENFVQIPSSSYHHITFYYFLGTMMMKVFLISWSSDHEAFL